MSGRGHEARTWFVTGGTPGGFGMAFAEAALDLGDQVVLTARRPAVATLEGMLADIRGSESLSRGADFPAAP